MRFIFEAGHYCCEEVISFTNGREIPRIITCWIIISFRNFPLTGNPFLIIVSGSLIICSIVVFPDSGIKSLMRPEVVMLYSIGSQVIFSKEKVVRVTLSKGSLSKKTLQEASIKLPPVSKNKYLIIFFIRHQLKVNTKSCGKSTGQRISFS